jgi:hypothetical protein
VSSGKVCQVFCGKGVPSGRVQEEWSFAGRCAEWKDPHERMRQVKNPRMNSVLSVNSGP